MDLACSQCQSNPSFVTNDHDTACGMKLLAAASLPQKALMSHPPAVVAAAVGAWTAGEGAFEAGALDAGARAGPRLVVSPAERSRLSGWYCRNQKVGHIPDGTTRAVSLDGRA